MNILIAGLGEIGRSIGGLYKDKEDILYFKDILYENRKEFDNDTGKVLNIDNEVNGKEIDVLHICIPFFHDFLKVVTSYIKQYEPNITFIHSTVDVGVTMDIYRYTNVDIVHSPVIGKHPNLTKSIRTFRKIVAGPNKESNDKAIKHLTYLGVKTEVFNSPSESEAAKLLSTSYFGWNILYMKYVHKFCEENNLDFEKVYTKTNEIYNEGYTKFGDTQFVRPVLKFMPGRIGGHCISPNFKIVKNKFFPAQVSIMLEDGLDNAE